MGNNTPLLLNVFEMKNFSCEFRYTWANNDAGFLMKEMTLRHNTVFFFTMKPQDVMTWLFASNAISGLKCERKRKVLCF